MTEVSDAIREGADGFFATQYGLISKLAIALSVVIYLIYSARALTKEQEDAGLSRQTFACLTTFSFLLGAACSGASGYVGMWAGVCSFVSCVHTRYVSRALVFAQPHVARACSRLKPPWTRGFFFFFFFTFKASVIREPTLQK